MTFADKLIQLRKKAGWSQEELAEQLDVTRQSISKWEGAQSLPDIEKIIRLSQLFGVSTDFLLKDEIEDTECNVPSKNAPTLRHVSIEDANTFLSIKVKTSKLMALATFLCILSPVCLLILGAISEMPEFGLKDNVAAGIGMIVLLILVATAVALFISSSRKEASYDFLEKEVFEIENGVAERVNDLRLKYSNKYTISNIIGVCLCIMAVIPIFLGMIFYDENALLQMTMICATLVIVGIGVAILINSSSVWSSYEQLLQDGSYSEEKKKNRFIMKTISFAYWLIATAIYLGYSFATNNWDSSWIVWPIAGVIFPVICVITIYINKRKQ